MVSRKLKNNSGASLMLALLFFLLCALAGSVVLAAGTAAAGRIKDVKATEQAYFTVMSAAELLRDEIDGKSLTYIYDDTGQEWVQKPEGNLSSLLMEYVANLAEYKYGGNISILKGSKKLTVEPSDSDTKESMGTVTADFSIKYDDGSENPAYTDYTIVITLSLEQAEGRPGYVCTLTIPASLLNNGTTGETPESSTSKTLSLIWSNPVITRGNDNE